MKKLSSREIEEILLKMRKATRDFEEKLAAPFIWEEYKDPFKVLIAIILSIRTQEKNTIRASKNLFEKFPDPGDIVNASDKEIEEAIKNVGLYKQKAKWIKEVARYYIEHRSLPKNRDELMKLPGVGRKVANVYLNIVHNENVIAVDTHVHRVSNRLGLVSTKNPEKTEIELYKVIPQKYWRDINELFIKFGKTICRPSNPSCDICPLKEYCKYYQDTVKKEGER